MRIVPDLILLLGLAMLSAASAPAVAGLRRCVDGNGVSVYTDRDCSQLDAVGQVGHDSRGVRDAGDLAAHDGGAAALTRFGVRGNGAMTPRGCARSPVSLLEGVRGSVETRDVNRLAAYYHWSGVSQSNARSLMTELEAVAARPLVAAVLAYPETAPVPEEFRLYEWPGERQAGASRDDTPDDGDETGLPPSKPVAIELQQMTGNNDAGARTVRFSLHSHAGCWWIRF